MAQEPQARGGFVVTQGFTLSRFEFAHTLQRAELRDAVFDVVKRIQKNVELAMPQIRPHVLVAGPVHVAGESVHELIPRGGTFRRGCAPDAYQIQC